MDCYNENRSRQLNRKMFDFRVSEFDSKKPNYNKVTKGGKFGDQEVDRDYAWLLNFLDGTNEPTKVVGSENENEIENVNEDKDEDDNDIDPQYSEFLKELMVNEKSYKLKVSRNDEAPRFLVYEKHEMLDGTFSNDNNGDSSEGMQIKPRVKKRVHGKKGGISTMTEVSKKIKINERKSITEPLVVESCYQQLLKRCDRSKYGEVNIEGQLVAYEKKDTSSDSDIEIWDNIQDCRKANNKRLKKKLIRILKQPYNKKEYKELSEYVKRKPICRLLPLRRRSISSALDGVKKSVLADSPACFERNYEDAKNKNEWPRALNLLRMFRFWLEHVPNEDVFEPWLDKDILKVLPLHRTR